MTVLRSPVEGSDALAPEPVAPTEEGIAQAIRRLDHAAITTCPLALEIPEHLAIGADLEHLLTALPEWSGPAPRSAGGPPFTDHGEHLELRTLAATRASTGSGSAAALVERLRCLRWLGQDDELIQVAAPLLDTSSAWPEYPEILTLLGRSLVRRPRSRLITEVLERLGQRPERWWVELAHLRHSSTPPIEVVAWIERHEPLARIGDDVPWWSWHHIAGGLAWSLGRLDDARDRTRRLEASARHPFERLWGAVLTVEIETGARRELALEECAALAARLGVRRFGALTWSARALACGPDAAQAVRHLRHAVALDPSQGLNLASALVMAGRFDEARDALARSGSTLAGANVVALALTDPADPEWERHFTLGERSVGAPSTTADIHRIAADRIPASPTNSRRVRVLDRARTHARRGGFDDAPYTRAIAESPTATPLGPYDLLEPLGAGRMGRVHLARHRLTRREVALKVLSAQRQQDAPLREALAREIRAQVRLAHPGIVGLLDCGEVDALAAEIDGTLRVGAPWLAMELVRGSTLSDVCGRWSWPDVRDALVAMLDALAHCHARGVVHCDLKPANVMLEQGRPRVADFGLARVGAGGLRGGTPAYMAPEQVDGRASARTDLYALGCIAVELVQGAPPYFGDAARLFAAHRTAARPRLEGRFPVPAGFDAWIAAAMAPDEGERFPTAAHMVDALASLPIGASAPTAGARRRSPTALTTLVLEALRDPTPERGVAHEIQACRPVPLDWRPARPAAAARPARAGVGPIEMRDPPFTGRTAERDALWNALRAADEGPVVMVVVAARGLGGRALCGWLLDRVAEMAVAVVRGSPDEVTLGPLQVIVVPELATVHEHLPRWRSERVRVLVVHRTTEPTSADRALTLGPLGPEAMRDLLAGYLDLSSHAMTDLVELARGWPDAAVATVRATAARGELVATPGGLVARGGWRVPTEPWDEAWSSRDPEALRRAALHALTRPLEARGHPGRERALLSALSLNVRRAVHAEAAEILGDRIDALDSFLLRVEGPPLPSLVDELVERLGSPIPGGGPTPDRRWSAMVRRLLRGGNAPAMLEPQAFGLRADDERCALLALHACLDAYRHAELDDAARWAERALAVDGTRAVEIRGMARYFQAVVAWRKGDADEAIRRLDDAVVALAGHPALQARALAKRGGVSLAAGRAWQADFERAEQLVDSGTVLVQRLYALERAGRFHEALAWIARTPEAERERVPVLDRWGCLLVDIGSYGMAEEVFRRALTHPEAIGMQGAILLENLAWAEALQGRLDDALRTAEPLAGRPSPTVCALFQALRADDPDADPEGYHRALMAVGMDEMLRVPTLRWAYGLAVRRAREAGLDERAAWLEAAMAELPPSRPNQDAALRDLTRP